MANNYSNNDDNLDQDKDLQEHGVRSIARDEYYTLDLGHNIDGDDDGDDMGGIDVASADPNNPDAADEPLGSSSFYEDATVVRNDPDYMPRSSNQGGVVREKDIIDEGTVTSDISPGHAGIDEDTG